MKRAGVGQVSSRKNRGKVGDKGGQGTREGRRQWRVGDKGGHYFDVLHQPKLPHPLSPLPPLPSP